MREFSIFQALVDSLSNHNLRIEASVTVFDSLALDDFTNYGTEEQPNFFPAYWKWTGPCIMCWVTPMSWYPIPIPPPSIAATVPLTPIGCGCAWCPCISNFTS